MRGEKEVNRLHHILGTVLSALVILSLNTNKVDIIIIQGGAKVGSQLIWKISQ